MIVRDKYIVQISLPLLQVHSVKKGATHNALYIGTSDGRVLKLYDPRDGPTTIVQSVKVFSRNLPIINLMATNEQVTNQLIILHTRKKFSKRFL